MRLSRRGAGAGGDGEDVQCFGEKLSGGGRDAEAGRVDVFQGDTGREVADEDFFGKGAGRALIFFGHVEFGADDVGTHGFDDVERAAYGDLRGAGADGGFVCGVDGLHGDVVEGAGDFLGDDVYVGDDGLLDIVGEVRVIQAQADLFLKAGGASGDVDGFGGDDADGVEGAPGPADGDFFGRDGDVADSIGEARFADELGDDGDGFLGFALELDEQVAGFYGDDAQAGGNTDHVGGDGNDGILVGRGEIDADGVELARVESVDVGPAATDGDFDAVEWLADQNHVFGNDEADGSGASHDGFAVFADPDVEGKGEDRGHKLEVEVVDEDFVEDESEHLQDHGRSSVSSLPATLLRKRSSSPWRRVLKWRAL